MLLIVHVYCANKEYVHKCNHAYIGEAGDSPPLVQLTASSISIKIARQCYLGLYEAEICSAKSCVEEFSIVLPEGITI